MLIEKNPSRVKWNKVDRRKGERGHSSMPPEEREVSKNGSSKKG
jgi:hypothetical protein